MKMSGLSALIFLVLISVPMTGCSHLPGKPGPEAPRPDQIMDFATLYKENCSACHGADGKNGAAIALANPVYLAWAGEDNLQQITAKGVTRTLMPAFSKRAGGMLTDQQIDNLVQGMLAQWGQREILNNQNIPFYAATTKGDTAQGKLVFEGFCSRCHRDDINEAAAADLTATGSIAVGSITDPSYLALVSAQDLRTITVVGMPNYKMPDWRGDVPGRPMTDKEVTDVVAWLISQRIQSPDQTLPQSHSE
jgi:cytochrome c oxidase cbb3-type subunit 3/ubiquinol-cytochrome c reductase cytochrome c subunit